jgi:hypothetical protein
VKRFLILALLLAFAAAGAEGHPAWGIAVSRDGAIFFSDLETIWKIEHGTLIKLRKGVAGRHIHDITLDDEGNLHGLEERPWKMTPDGRWQYADSPPARGVALRLDHAGNLYSIEQNNHTKSRTVLLKGTPKGDLSVFAGGAYGFGDGKGTGARFSNVVGMAWGPDGSLYLTDGRTIRRVTLQANVTTVASGLGTPQSPNFLWESVMGLAVSRDGTMYVADFGNRRVMTVGARGRMRTLVEAQPPWSPTGVAVSEKGDVYTLEFSFVPPGTWSGPRVRKILPDGTAVTIATLPGK